MTASTRRSQHDAVDEPRMPIVFDFKLSNDRTCKVVASKDVERSCISQAFANEIGLGQGLAEGLQQSTQTLPRGHPGAALQISWIVNAEIVPGDAPFDLLLGRVVLKQLGLLGTAVEGHVEKQAIGDWKEFAHSQDLRKEEPEDTHRATERERRSRRDSFSSEDDDPIYDSGTRSGTGYASYGRRRYSRSRKNRRNYFDTFLGFFGLGVRKARTRRATSPIDDERRRSRRSSSRSSDDSSRLSTRHRLFLQERANHKSALEKPSPRIRSGYNESGEGWTAWSGDMATGPGTSIQGNQTANRGGKVTINSTININVFCVDQNPQALVDMIKELTKAGTSTVHVNNMSSLTSEIHTDQPISNDKPTSSPSLGTQRIPEIWNPPVGPLHQGRYPPARPSQQTQRPPTEPSRQRYANDRYRPNYLPHESRWEDESSGTTRPPRRQPQRPQQQVSRDLPPPVGVPHHSPRGIFKGGRANDRNRTTRTVHNYSSPRRSHDRFE